MPVDAVAREVGYLPVLVTCEIPDDSARVLDTRAVEIVWLESMRVDCAETHDHDFARNQYTPRVGAASG